MNAETIWMMNYFQNQVKVSATFTIQDNNVLLPENSRNLGIIFNSKLELINKCIQFAKALKSSDSSY